MYDATRDFRRLMRRRLGYLALLSEIHHVPEGPHDRPTSARAEGLRWLQYLYQVGVSDRREAGRAPMSS